MTPTGAFFIILAAVAWPLFQLAYALHWSW